jgi:hypothetical protein
MKEDKIIQFDNEKQSSIGIEKNSKGYNWSIKIYFDESKQEHSKVIEKIEKIDKELKLKFNEVI